MVTPEILEYIKQQKAAGCAEEDIKKAMIGQGWDPKDINDAFGPTRSPFIPTPTMQTYQRVVEKSSGSTLALHETTVRGWSWGAFGLSWVWGIRFGVLSAFLTWIPLVGLVWIFFLGAKGNQWAQEKNPEIPPAKLAKDLREWNKWGLILFLTQTVIFIAYIIFMVSIGFTSFKSIQTATRDDKRIYDIRYLHTGLVNYGIDHQSIYPTSLSVLIPMYLTTAVQPPLPNETYGYETTTTRTHFLVYAQLEKTKEYIYSNDAGVEGMSNSIPVCNITCP